eukprot:TRINITY_DN778161_c0_g1_i1.p1 TRINITY_DN778161_c0_g1~~TRINITY_DN778161_c0_g1_i1.p1  ORF type:complete len:407 (-),score=92.11 TRINITY_DN778161_c0_g1_i1:124-1311(-)
MYCGDEVGAIVVDIGAQNARFGFGGEDIPKHCFSSTAGHLVDVDGQRNICVGDSAIHIARENLELQPCLRDGNITDFEAFQNIHSYGFDQMRVNPKNHPVLCTEAFDLPKASREKYLEMMFETTEAPAVYLAKTAMLSAFSTGKSTALVCEMGAGGSTVVPVHEGHVLLKASKRHKYGGNAMANELMRTIEKENTIHPRHAIQRNILKSGRVSTSVDDYDAKYTKSFNNFMKLEIIEDIQHTFCSVSKEPLEGQVYAEPESFELPDGTTLRVNAERFTVPEQLFSSQNGNVSFAKMAHSAIADCNPDIRKDICNQVIVTGGISKMEGLEERLHQDLSDMLPLSMKVRMIQAGPLERQFSSWIGGSILSSLGTFQQLWISREQYNEHGSSVVEACP